MEEGPCVRQLGLFGPAVSCVVDGEANGHGVTFRPIHFRNINTLRTNSSAHTRSTPRAHKPYSSEMSEMQGLRMRSADNSATAVV